MKDDLEKLFDKFPFFLYDILTTYSYKTQLIEIVLDLGRRPEARSSVGPEYLAQKVISWISVFIFCSFNSYAFCLKSSIQELYEFLSIQSRY